MPVPRGAGFLSRFFNTIKSRINYEKFNAGKGVVVGKDHLGNTYYEVPADPSHGFRKPRRSFEGQDDESWSVPMPMEWESWLRNRRDAPPTPDEIFGNMQIAANRKRLGDESHKRLSTKEATKSDSIAERYPRYEEYQGSPDGDLQRLTKSIDKDDSNKK